MVHIFSNTIVHTSHQGSFHGREGPGENMLRIGGGKLSHTSTYKLGRKGGNDLPHIV